MKKLEHWLIDHDMSKSDIAVLCGVAPAYIRAIFRGDVRCSKHLAKRIQDSTQGHITVQEIMAIYTETDKIS